MINHKTIKMKKFLTTFAIIFSFMSILSCDEKSSPVSVSNIQTGTLSSDDDKVKEMKQWFEKNVANQSNTRDDLNTIEKDIDWGKPLIRKSGNEDYVIVPIRYKNPIIASEKVNGMFENFDLSMYANSYLLLKNGKEKKALLINYIADKDYFRNNDFKVEGSSFSGKMLVKDWNEELLYGYVIENGKIKSTIIPEDKASNKNGRVTGCITISMEYYSVACAQGYPCGPPLYMHTTYTFICDYTAEEYNPDTVNWSLVPFGGQTYDPSATLNTPEAQQFLFERPNAFENLYYTTHPWLINSAIRNKNTAASLEISNFLVDRDGCNGNAFKHAIWSGLNTLTWNHETAKYMGDIHELQWDNSNLNKQMDLANNALGIEIAKDIKTRIQDPKDQISELKRLLLDAIQYEHKGTIIHQGKLIQSNSFGANWCQ